MWSWWKKSDPTRSARVPGLIGEPSLQDLFVQQGSSHFDVDSEQGIWTSVNSPRTLKDLSSMTQAAKEAQWGNPGESDASSTEFPVVGNDFFDDDSNASSDSGEDNLDGQTAKVDLYNEPRDKSTPGQKEVLVNSKEVPPVSGGAASDMLTPFVKVSNEYNRLSLNNQSLELALGWKLGDFDVDPSQPIYESREKPKSTHFLSHVNPFYDSTIMSPDIVSNQGKLIFDCC
jgi:hypothetical protein